TYYRYQGVPAERTYVQFEDKPRFDEVEEIADRYLAEYIAGRLDRVEVAYMRFLSASRQKPEVATLLPLSSVEPDVKRKAAGEAVPARPVEYEVLPSAANILEELLPVSF